MGVGSYQLAIETIERLMPYYQELKQPHNVHKSCRDIVIIHMCSKGPADAEQAWYQFATYASSCLVSSCDRGTDTSMQRASEKKRLEEFRSLVSLAPRLSASCSAAVPRSRSLRTVALWSSVLGKPQISSVSIKCRIRRSSRAMR